MTPGAYTFTGDIIQIHGSTVNKTYVNFEYTNSDVN